MASRRDQGARQFMGRRCIGYLGTGKVRTYDAGDILRCQSIIEDPLGRFKIPGYRAIEWHT